LHIEPRFVVSTLFVLLIEKRRKKKGKKRRKLTRARKGEKKATVNNPILLEPAETYT
jgi:hypothetical protein